MALREALGAWAGDKEQCWKVTFLTRAQLTSCRGSAHTTSSARRQTDIARAQNHVKPRPTSSRPRHSLWAHPTNELRGPDHVTGWTVW
jgi:hypothetical protein